MAASTASASQDAPLHRPRLLLEELQSDSRASSIEAARELLLEYGCFVAAQPSVASFCLGALEEEAANLPYSYLDRSGGAMLATFDRRPVAFIAWRSLPVPELSDAWELKRLWTRPEARGLGVGQALVEAVTARARAAGKTALLLDTAPGVMAAAVRLYRRLGFEECPSYNGRSLDGIAYLSKSLL